MTAVGWQRIEGALVLIAALAFLYHLTPFAWWHVPLFLAPDLAMIGNAAGPRVGAALYNAAHLYGVPLALMIPLVLWPGSPDPVLYSALVLWVGHIGFDRALGYGLKENTGFHDTHLGRIGS